ncbi:MAG: LysR family transcriptional regulator [Candidatus Limnocylindrales bacterium]
MELRVLRYFLAIADTGSVVAAAQALSTSQPSLSRQIRELEAELGVELFERGKGKLRVSTSGRRLLPLARDIITQANDLSRLVSEAIATGPLTVVAPLTFIEEVLAPFLTEPEASGAIVHPREVAPSDVIRVLEAGEADLAVSSWPVPDRFATRMLTRPPLWAYVSPTHRLARRHAVEVGELAQERLIVLAHEHGTRRLFDEAIMDAGVAYEPHLVTNLPIIAMALAAAGHGVAIVTDEPRFGLHRLAVRERRAPLRLSMLAAWDAKRYSAPAVQRFVEVFASYCWRTRPT